MKVTLLAGGTGGAKLAHGLQQVLPPGDLSVVVNVADDPSATGLLVCPDLDTILYTLAGLADPSRAGAWRATRTPPWGCWSGTAPRPGSAIGDADLATHVQRAHLMREGATLTDATAAMAHALGVPSRLRAGHR